MVNLPAFFSYIFLSAFTPGPNNIMAMTNAGQYGFKKSLRFCSGVFLGMLAVMSCCAVLGALLYSFIPKIEPVMIYIGAAYILWLAWRVYSSKPQESAEGETGGGALLKPNGVFSGAFLQFVNIKLMLYGITALSTFILPYHKGVPMITIFVIILSLMGFAGTICWALFGAAFEKLFREHSKVMNTIMALLLVYCAATLMIK